MSPKPKTEITVEYDEPVSEEAVTAFLDALANIVIDHFYSGEDRPPDDPIVGD